MVCRLEETFRGIICYLEFRKLNNTICLSLSFSAWNISTFLLLFLQVHFNFFAIVFKWIFLNLLMIFPSWYPAHCSMAHVSLTFPNVTICLHKSIDFYCLCTCLHLLVFLCIFQCLYFVHHDMYLNMYVSKILLIHAYVHIHA